MQAVLGFLQGYETLIYLLLGVAFLLYAWRAWQARQRLRDAIFGLERVHAEQRLRRSIIGMGMTFLMALTVFSLNTYVAPYRSEVILPTATPNVLATPGTGTPQATAAAVEEEQPTPTPIPPPEVSTEGCIPGQIEITAPKNGDTLKGTVDVVGSAVSPDFGFYKIDIAPVSQALFLTIYASHTPVKEGTLLKEWNTAEIPPGEYVLQLVVVDNKGQPKPPCRLRIHIVPPPAEKP